MAYRAIYRKWRPEVFEDVVGQEHITKTLQHQVETGTLSHAYLFCGTRGTGKTTAAKILSRAVNCLNPKNGSPCNECSICKGIADGSIMDVYEIDAASNNGVDNIREIIDDAKYVATEAKYRVYIIDEVHMLSGGAFNALLKTLEEPPSHVIFILATTEAHKVPQTILSRCQRFDFKRIRPEDIIRRMREIAMGDGLSISDDAYNLLAQLADGSMRDGLSVMERCISSVGTTLTYEAITSALGIAGNEVLFKITDCINNENSQGILELIAELTDSGKDLHVFIDSLTEHYRNLIVCKLSDEPDSLLNRDAEEIIKLKAQAKKTSFEKLSNAAASLTKARNEAKWVKQPRIIYELALLKLAKPELDCSYEAILDRLSDCEEKIKDGITVKTEPAPAEEVKKPKKPQPSARLFVPVDISTLTPDTPSVTAARRWDKIAQTVAKKMPHVAASVIGKQVTVDGEGLIIVYQKNEMMLKRIASTFLPQIAECVRSAAGTDITVKTAFFDDIEDSIIDVWKIGGEQTPANSDNTDPIEKLQAQFSELVEITDETDFIGYSPTEDNFTQSQIAERLEEDDDDDDDEEFL